MVEAPVPSEVPPLECHFLEGRNLALIRRLIKRQSCLESLSLKLREGAPWRGELLRTVRSQGGQRHLGGPWRKTESWAEWVELDVGWVGPKVHSSFLFNLYGKTQKNFSANSLPLEANMKIHFSSIISRGVAWVTICSSPLYLHLKQIVDT